MSGTMPAAGFRAVGITGGTNSNSAWVDNFVGPAPTSVLTGWFTTDNCEPTVVTFTLSGNSGVDIGVFGTLEWQTPA